MQILLPFLTLVEYAFITYSVCYYHYAATCSMLTHHAKS